MFGLDAGLAQRGQLRLQAGDAGAQLGVLLGQLREPPGVQQHVGGGTHGVVEGGADRGEGGADAGLEVAGERQRRQGQQQRRQHGQGGDAGGGARPGHAQPSPREVRAPPDQRGGRRPTTAACTFCNVSVSSSASPQPCTDGAQRILRHVDREASLGGDAAIEAAQQAAPAGHGDAVHHQVGNELRRGPLDRLSHRAHDFVDNGRERVADLHRRDLDRLWQAGRQVAPAQVDRPLLVEREGGARLDLDRLGGAFADQHVVHLARVDGDRLVHRVAGRAHRGRDDDAAERDHGHLGGAAADIDDHGAGGLHHRQPRADRRGHRLFDQVGGAGAGGERSVMDGALLHLRRPARYADDDAGLRDAQPEALVHAADEVLKHAFRDAEVGDHAVAQRPYRHDRRGCAADHALRLVADGEDALRDAVDGDDRGFVDHDAAASHHHQGVGRTEVDADVVREHAQKRGQWIDHVLSRSHGESLGVRSRRRVGKAAGECNCAAEYTDARMGVASGRLRLAAAAGATPPRRRRRTRRCRR